MKHILLLIMISFTTAFNANAVVVVNTPNNNTQSVVSPEKDKLEKKVKKHSFSFKKFFKKIARIFDFDLSDPVDGWLTLVILLILGAIALIIVGSIIGSSVLSLIGSILAVGGLASFIVWVIKMV